MKIFGYTVEYTLKSEHIFDYMSFRTIQLELTTISKTIAGLLTQPLSSVVVRLRELKASQSAKRKQLESLEVRERTVLKRITSGESEDAYGEEGAEGEGEGTGGDMSFGLPLAMEGGRVTDEQRLIQTGQLTPFGGKVQDTAGQPSSSTSSSVTVELPTASNSLPSSSATPNSLPVTPSATATPTIQLSNDSFDGLFSDTVITKPKKKSTSKKSKSPEKKGDIGATNSNSHVDDQGALSMQEIITQSGSLEQGMENGGYDNEEWMPDEAELAMFESEMLSSSESEYLTDDEMGTPQKKKRKQKVLRELSSDEDDIGDHVTSKGRGRKRKGKRKHYQDDGDDELYRLRIW